MSSYADRAENLLIRVDHLLDGQATKALVESTRAVALATLAVAEQQRIANIIAAYDHKDTRTGDALSPLDYMPGALHNEVLQGLDITE